MNLDFLRHIYQRTQRKLGLKSSRQSFGLNQLDLKLNSYLNFKNGFFIEAGANDGCSQSNTMYFEKYMKWRGLLIEAVPELAEKCKANRANSIVENCALVPLDYDKSDIEIRYCHLMSLVKGAMKSEEDELEHVRRGCDIQDIESYVLKVPAKTLTSILDQHGINQIDFFSLDVEGYELNALKGLDLDKYCPQWLLIEARYRDEIDAYLSPYYEPIAELSHHDVLYHSKKLK